MLLSLCFNDTQIVFLSSQKWYNANSTSVHHIPSPKKISWYLLIPLKVNCCRYISILNNCFIFHDIAVPYFIHPFLFGNIHQIFSCLAIINHVLTREFEYIYLCTTAFVFMRQISGVESLDLRVYINIFKFENHHHIFLKNNLQTDARRNVSFI